MLPHLLLLRTVTSWLPVQSVEQNGLLCVLIFDIKNASVMEAMVWHPGTVGRLNTFFKHKCHLCSSGYSPACSKVIQL